MSNKWPNFLKNPDTRASHIAILVVVSILFILAIVIVSWAAYRTFHFNDTNQNFATTRALLTKYEKIKQELSSATSNYIQIDNKLVDPVSIGTRFIKNGECIKSLNGRFQLQLTWEGNGELWDLEMNQKIYQTNTINLESPGQRFLCGCDGFCYVLRDDGTRSRDQTGKFYKSPNQLCPYYNGPNGKTFIDRPYTLEFYENGICLYSTSRDNNTITNSSRNVRVNLWWAPPSAPRPQLVIVLQE